jgi:hypothetical protein
MGQKITKNAELFQKLIKSAELFKKLTLNYFTSYDRSFIGYFTIEDD